jgi:hypothetical protein
MNYYEAPDLAHIYLARLRAMVLGERVMHGVQYSERGDEFHLSEFQLCPLPALYRRTWLKQPELSDDAILRFFRGRIIERAIAKEAESVVVDGIHCTVDDIHPEHGLIEIKSTAKGSEFFDPPKEQQDWIERMMGYAHAYSVQTFGLVVFFLTGNMSDYLPWAIKKNGRVKTGYRGIEMKAWRFEFTAEELKANWDEMLRRKAVLEEALNGIPMTEDEINSRRPTWQCKVCQYAVACEFNTQAEKQLEATA